MKPMLLIVSLLLLFSSCVRNNYFFVSGQNLAKNVANDLIAEDDTLKVEYDFVTYRGKVLLKITNKTDEFVEMDWKKSAIIVGGKAVSYYDPQVTLSGVLQRDTTLIRDNPLFGSASYLADVNASITINHPAEFVFPKTSLWKTCPATSITQNLWPTAKFAKDQGQKINLPKNGQFAVSYKKVEFPAEKSPLVFKSFLTYRIGKGDEQREISKEHIFFVSELWESEFGPEDLPEQLVNRPNRLN